MPVLDGWIISCPECARLLSDVWAQPCAHSTDWLPSHQPAPAPCRIHGRDMRPPVGSLAAMIQNRVEGH